MQKKLDEVGLQKRWLHMELDRIAGVKNVCCLSSGFVGTDIHDIFFKEEENDITLPPVKVDPEFVGHFNDHGQNHDHPFIKPL